jgi:putative tryptophan/tyrosine transport system substrate-binding protein
MNSRIHKINLVFQTSLVLLAWACAANEAQAQASKLPKIGELWTTNASEVKAYRDPFVARLRELGWVDGKTAQFITRYYGADVQKARALAKELVALKVDVLAVNDLVLGPAREATSTIPIVCMDMYDPVAEGATTSLATPSGNVTGVSWQSLDTAVKRVEISKDLLPNLKRVALIYDATDPGAKLEHQAVTRGAHNINVQLDAFGLRGPRDVDPAITAVSKAPPDVLIIAVSPLTIEHLDKITRLAAQIPTVSELRDFARAGVLLTYGVNIGETYSRAADQVHRILKGAKPRDLPYEQPTKFDLIVNLKTAKALGIKVPESILLRATEVIR